MTYFSDEYIGCYNDTGERDLGNLTTWFSDNTPQKCISFCKDNGKHSYLSSNRKNSCFSFWIVRCVLIIKAKKKEPTIELIAVILKNERDNLKPNLCIYIYI